VPKQTAIDFISGNQFSFVGDSIMKEDGYLRNFHLKPARTLYRTRSSGPMQNLYISYPFIQYYDKRILLVDKPYTFYNDKKIPVDVIVVSKSPRIKIADLASAFDCKQYVFDGSNSLYKMNQWKKDCDSLHLPHHFASDKGAFVLSW
jgi:competence protein ComEC